MSELAVAPGVTQRRGGASYVWTISVLSLCFAFSMLDRQILSIIATPLKADLGIGDFGLSILMGPAFAISYIAFGVIFGVLSDKWSRPKTVFVGLVTWMLATVGCGLSASFLMLVGFRSLVGAGEAALSPVAHAIIAENVPKERLSLSISIYTWGATLGMGASMMFGGAALDWITAQDTDAWPLIGALAPWQIVLVLVALPGIVLAPLALTLPERDKNASVHAGHHESGAGFAAFVSRRKWFLICHFMGYGLSNMVVSTALVWTPQFLERTYGMPASQVGATFGPMALICPVVGGLATALVIDRSFKSGMRDAHMRLYAIMLACGAPFACYAFFSPTPLWFWVGALFIMLVMNSIFSSGAAALQIASPSAFRGRLSGALVSFVSVAGAILGPMAVGALVDFVFKDPSKLGVALGVLTTFGIVAALPFFWFGARFMREAVSEMQDIEARGHA